MPRIPPIYAEFRRNRIKYVREVYNFKNTEWDPKMPIFSSFYIWYYDFTENFATVRLKLYACVTVFVVAVFV